MTSTKTNQTESRLVVTLQVLFPGSNIDIQDLKRPTPEFVLEWYSSFLSCFYMNCDLLFQVSTTQNNLFGNTLPLAKLAKILRNVFDDIFNEIAPFGILDLLRPSPGRTVMFFSGMANLLSYCGNKYSEIEAFLGELDDKKAHWNELLQKREDLLASLNERANIRAHLDDLELKITKKQKQLRDLADEVSVLEKETADKENINEKLEAKLSQFKKDLSQAEQEMEAVSLQVVDSPQSVKFEEAQLKQKLEDLEEKVISAQAMVTNKRELVKTLQNFTQELQMRHIALEKLVSDWRSINEGKGELANLHKTHAKLSEDLLKENAERRNLDVQEKQLFESLSSLQLRRDAKKQDFQSQLLALKKENKEVSKQNAEELRRLQNEEKSLIQAISVHVKTNEALNKRYGELYASLLAGERRLGENVVGELGEAAAKLKPLKQ